MGIAWCRERVEQAQNSKNPVDRILIRCSNAIKPKTNYSRSQDKIADDIVYKGMRSKNFISPPVPVHAVPPRHRKSDWQSCALTVPDGQDSKAPIPPPRKKRKRKINSLQVISTQLQLLQQQGYSNYTENLLNHEYISTQDPNGKSKDVSHPFSNRNYDKEKPITANEPKRQNRYIKSSSENRMSGGKIKKTESSSSSSSFHPATHNNPYSGNDEKVKNDNNRKKATEQKIKVVKNVSTVSLPNYNELVKPVGKVSSDVENSDDKTGNQSVGSSASKPPRRNSSAISLPGEGSNSILTSLSEATINRLESYMKRCRSFGSLKPQQLIEKLEEFKKTHRTASESEDSWSGLDDWDLGVIEYCDAETSGPPLIPKSTVRKDERVPLFSVGSEEILRSHTPPLPPEEIQTCQTPPPLPPEEILTCKTSPLPEAEIPRCVTPVEPDEKSKMLPEVCADDIVTSIFQTEHNIPSDWFVNGTKPEETEAAEAPPPTPETMENNNNHNTEQINLLEEAAPAQEAPIPPRRKSKDEQKRKRKRSHSLNPDYQKLKILYARSPSLSLKRTTSLIEELAKAQPEIESELMSNPKKIIKNLKEECLSQSLPEDPFEIFINRKKPSLRESLTQFLGFEPENEQNQAEISLIQKSEEAAVSTLEDVDFDRKTPPPLPASPPPSLDSPMDNSRVVADEATLTSSNNPLVKSSDQNPHIM